MITTGLQAGATEQIGNTGLNIAIFTGFVALTLIFVIRASRTNKTTADMYTGGAAFSGRQNGFAISGDYLSAASFLGIAGAIALTGYDGFLYSVGFLVAWVVALLLVAELLRNTGRFTACRNAQFARPQLSRPWSSRSSTCWRKWPVPVDWWRCC